MQKTIILLILSAAVAFSAPVILSEQFVCVNSNGTVRVVREIKTELGRKVKVAVDIPESEWDAKQKSPEKNNEE